MSSLLQKTTAGFFWSVIERFAAQGISFLLGIILARLLLPEDFGTIGVLTVFFSLSQCFIDSGLSQALIQKQGRTAVDYSTAFYFNLVMSVLFYLILFVSAPYIALFYDQPVLVELTRVVGLVVIISSLAIIPRTILTIDIDFKKQAKVSVVAALISGAVGVYCAYTGFGVWSLVYQSLVGAVIKSVLLLVITKWYPQGVFSKKSFVELFSYGSKLLGASLINDIYSNVYTVVVGKVFSLESLGYFTRAKTLSDFPSKNLTGILQRVSFPVLSSIQNDEERLRISYRRFLKMTAFMVFPLMIGLAVLARPLVLVLLTDKWLPSVFFLQVLSVSSMLYPIHAINLNIFYVIGRTDLVLKLEFPKKIVGIIILIVTVQISLNALVVGMLVFSVFALFVNTWNSKKIIGYSSIEQLKDLLPILLLSIGMAFVMAYGMSFFEQSWALLLVGGALGVLVYMLGAMLFRFDEINEIKNILNKKKE